MPVFPLSEFILSSSSDNADITDADDNDEIERQRQSHRIRIALQFFPFKIKFYPIILFTNNSLVFSDDNESLSAAPRAAAEVLHNMYIDDLATSCESLNEARRLAAQQEELMTSGGFHRTSGLATSNPNGKTVDRSQRMPLEDAGNLFGSQEGPSDLYLSAYAATAEIPSPSCCARHPAYSTCRLFGPIHGKGQDLIPVPMTARDVLGRTLARGRGMTVVQVKRVELHAFCDTSELAYGTVVYLRVETCAPRALVNLVTAKTRVAPIKRLSLPL
ncbi:hypothetical protein T12_8049 [Trichinella patagoniensis]|uniref:Uncharacterized protein n=1 Tax=Trichinella patagoniensis TaxID=990121 RepID=A0A0V0ZCT1_9BILA|nr:hypothetical protein T12_8049 [Trichinella patagoniensis]